MKQFDAYEIIGVIVPGAIIAATATIEVEAFRDLIGTEGASIGGLGLFIIASFILGHLVQSLGNIIEWVNWLPDSWPTDRVRFTAQKLISSDQRKQLEQATWTMEGNQRLLESYNSQDWKAVTARMSSRLRTAGKSSQMDFANRNYGLFRGIISALVVVFAWYALSDDVNWAVLGALFAMMLAALLRMRRFAVLYARYLFQSFIDMSSPQTD